MQDNTQMLAEQLKSKWSPVIDHPELPAIGDAYKRNVTAVLLENQEIAMREQAGAEWGGLNEASPANAIGDGSGADQSDGAGSPGIRTFNPVLISLVRRAMPNLMAFDVMGVQPMTGPTGLIFALKAKYKTQGGTEALHNEAVMDFSGSTGNNAVSAPASDPFADVTSNDGAVGDGQFPGSTMASYPNQHGMSTTLGEGLGATDEPFGQMAFSIDRTSVVAKTRALKAEYTTELAQDLKAVHGLDAETELANILSNEILAEINREVIRTINKGAKLGAQQGDLYYRQAGGTGGTYGLATSVMGGIYDCVKDSDGRWSAERFRGLLFQLEREANEVAKQTRRGKGNILICSSDVASALSMSGWLQLSGGDAGNLVVDDTGNTFAGTLMGGKMKVYIDPYATVNYCTVGYRGSSAYDAGMFYCPYVPLQMVRAVGENTFQPKIGFKTRYGLVNNPFVGASYADPALSASNRRNQFYRIFRVDNLHGINAGGTV
jgi:hypothetical protein